MSKLDVFDLVFVITATMDDACCWAMELMSANSRLPTTPRARLASRGIVGWHSWTVASFRVARWAWRRAEAFP